MGKTLITSKTFWVNLVAFTLIVLQGTGTLPGVDYASIEVGALGIINILLRLITKEPITAVVVSPD